MFGWGDAEHLAQQRDDARAELAEERRACATARDALREQTRFAAARMRDVSELEEHLRGAKAAAASAASTAEILLGRISELAPLVSAARTWHAAPSPRAAESLVHEINELERRIAARQ